MTGTQALDWAIGGWTKGMQDKRILVVGAGIAGLSSALMLAKNGNDVMVIDAQDNWEITGAGLTISGPSFRAIEALGILSDVMNLGHTHPGIKVHDTNGHHLKTLISPSIAAQNGEPLPGAGGILRSTLHGILLKHLSRLGIEVQMGLKCTSITQDGLTPDGSSRARVSFSDQRTLDFDAVVVGEGLYSNSRHLLWPDTPSPTFTGQACWRVVLERPQSVDHRFFFLGGSVKVGLTPVSSEHMYLFLLESIALNAHRNTAELHVILKNLLSEFSGELSQVRQTLNAQSHIVYRPLESHFLSASWSAGCVVLVGDAAHATTPQLASGAGMAMEDGIVLSEEFLNAENTTEAFQSYFRRRSKRCKMVVQNSLQIGQLELERASAVEQAQVVESSLAQLAAPY
jgi:2-polyprenyl-6-methoxyphenol hydroxylase-like FAD-dependent oxidoreductase